jgi:predicted P-loop ATPase
MKEFIWNLMQRVGNFFHPLHAKQMRTQPEKDNGNTRKLQRFLLERFEFRHNRLTGVTEYRPKGISDAHFSPIDERNMNGMIVDARLKGIVCWNSMVPTLVLSDKVEDYHPFHLYMAELPQWDGTDRVTPLLNRVSDDSLWLRGGRYWLRALTAQWMGQKRTHANTLVPVLVSNEQGLGKSTFCRSLLPDSLRDYYLDNLNLAPGASPEKKLVKAGLVNLDEFDKINEKRQPDLKNLLQMMSVPIYRGKRLGYVTEPRLASFIATTNSRQILSDPTGSRRFLCVEVTDMIPNEAIEHKQFYAQLKQEVLNGERDYLDKEEEKEVQRRNKAYYRQSPLEDVFHACFRRPKPEEEGEWFTAAEIFRLMNKRNASALRGISAKHLSFRLTAMGFKPRHTMYGNCYHVVRAEAA